MAQIISIAEISIQKEKQFSDLIAWFAGHLEGEGLSSWHMETRIHYSSFGQTIDQFRFWNPNFGWELNVKATRGSLSATIFVMSVGHFVLEKIAPNKIKLTHLEDMKNEIFYVMAFISDHYLNAWEKQC